MAKKPTVLTHDEIVTQVSAETRTSVGWYDTKLSRERERVTKYYNGTLPKRQHEGSSTYTSTDVYDSVETAKAHLLEAFAGGDEIAQFDPDQDMDVESCLAATKYASYTIFRENDGFGVFNSVIHDGLTARAGIAKVWWETASTFVEESFDGLSYDDATALAAQEDVEEFDADHDDATGTFAGTLTRKTDASKVAVAAIAPEEFLITPRAVSIAKARYCAHRTFKTRADLLEEGYEPKKIALLPKGSDDPNDTPEALARHEQVESGVRSEGSGPEADQIEVYESYMRIQIDSSKGVRLYRIVHAHNVLLDLQEVDKAPFIAYVPLPIPHSLYGNNFAARVIPTQNARTVLVRGVLDHTAITTNPRWAVVSGGLLNPREMMENRLGGLVNVRRPDSIAPLPQTNLNPFVFEVLRLLSDDKAQSTGMSSLSQGLNKDALSKQNSASLVDQMMTAGGQREKIAARNFAYNFFVPLMIEIVRLAILNEDKSKVIELAGAPIEVSPQYWTERKTCTVSMHLGYGEKDQAVMKMTRAYDLLAKDPALQTMFSPQNRYELIRDTMKMAGLTRAPAYITSPDKAPPPQPDQFKVKELEIKDKLATASVASSQANQMKVQKGMIIDSQRMDIARQKLAQDAQDEERTQNRLDLETTSRVHVAQEELEIQRTVAENQADKQSVTASVNP